MLGRRAKLVDQAHAHHRDPIRQDQRFFLIVSDLDRRTTMLQMQPAQFHLHLLPQLPVQCTRRLVHQQDIRFDHKRPRHCNALLLSARHLLHRPIPESFQLHQCQRCLANATHCD